MVRPPRWALSVGKHNSRLATIFLQGVCGNRQESDMRNLLVHPYALTYGDHRRTPLRGECQIRWSLRCTSSSLHHLSYHCLSIECRGHHWRVSQEGGTFYSTITPPVLPPPFCRVYRTPMMAESCMGHIGPQLHLMSYHLSVECIGHPWWSNGVWDISPPLHLLSYHKYMVPMNASLHSPCTTTVPKGRRLKRGGIQSATIFFLPSALFINPRSSFLTSFMLDKLLPIFLVLLLSVKYVLQMVLWIIVHFYFTRWWGIWGLAGNTTPLMK